MYIKRKDDGTYKIYNKKWDAVLYCAEDAAEDGDKWAWFYPKGAFNKDDRNARWRIELQKDGYYKVINDHFGCPLFTGDTENDIGDRWCWVEPNEDYEYEGKERWAIVRCLCDAEKASKPYLANGWYKLMNQKWEGTFFCGDNVDDDGRHWAWTEPHRDYENNGKERMYFERQEDDGTYKIYNQKWDCILYCAEDTPEEGGDRWAWFYPKESYDKDCRNLRWRIEQQSDGYYKLFNEEFGGPLFCGDSEDDSGDHWAWVEPNVDYENGGKERWTIVQVSYE